MVSWMIGRNLFYKYFLDADWAIDTFSWHWLSCNAFFEDSHTTQMKDTQKYFKKCDPEGLFIREFVPELQRYPNKYIYEPWKAPLDQQIECGCIIGEDYPYPFK